MGSFHCDVCHEHLNIIFQFSLYRCLESLVIMRSLLCLLLTSHHVLNLQIVRHSGEVSDESQESLEINDNVSSQVEVCTGHCLVTDTNTQKKNEADLCNFGCKSMKNVFEDLKSKFSSTDAQYLLGNALDQCWEGCVDNFSAGVSSCTSGCDAMRNIQKKIIKTAKIENSEYASNEETLEDFQPENFKLQVEDADIEQIPVVRTFVLWRPNSVDMEGVYTSYNTMVSLMQEMFGDLVTEGEDVERIGYQDDRTQLSLPGYREGSAPLTSQQQSQTDRAKKAVENLYQNIQEKFENIALNLRRSLQSPRYRELIFYVLMTLCCFLILTAIFDILNDNKRQNAEEDEDRYHLEDTAIKAKLPSYEECMLQDPIKEKLAVHLQYEQETEEKCDKV